MCCGHSFTYQNQYRSTTPSYCPRCGRCLTCGVSGGFSPQRPYWNNPLGQEQPYTITWNVTTTS